MSIVKGLTLVRTFQLVPTDLATDDLTFHVVLTVVVTGVNGTVVLGG